jgi:hypothetical protein
LWRFPPLNPQAGDFIFSMARPFSCIQRCVVYRYI